MAIKIRRVSYFHTTVKDRPGEAFKILSSLAQGDVNLLAFAAVPLGPDRAQLTLFPEHVQLVGKTSDWLRYRLPKRMIRKNSNPVCIGQKQIWFMLKLTGSERDFNLGVMDQPEFDQWCWVDYWHPMEEVVFFKRKVYRQALSELEHLLFSQAKKNSRLG